MPRKRKSGPKNRTRPRQSRVSPARDAAACKWLKKSAASVAADETQQKLQAAAEPFIGVLSGGNPANAQSVRKVIRRRLARRYGRWRTHRSQAIR